MDNVSLPDATYERKVKGEQDTLRSISFICITYLVLLDLCLHFSKLVNLNISVKWLKGEMEEKPAHSSRKLHPGSSSSDSQELTPIKKVKIQMPLLILIDNEKYI